MSGSGSGVSGRPEVVVLCLNTPNSLRFGIDNNFWETGPNFMGVRGIPPGVHFIHYQSIGSQGSTSVPTSFFYPFQEHQVLVLKWDPDQELFLILSDSHPEVAQRYVLGFERHEFDTRLGPYPEPENERFKSWQSFVGQISPAVVARISPVGRSIHPGGESGSLDAEIRIAKERLDREELRAQETQAEQAHRDAQRQQRGKPREQPGDVDTETIDTDAMDMDIDTSTPASASTPTSPAPAPPRIDSAFLIAPTVHYYEKQMEADDAALAQEHHRLTQHQQGAHVPTDTDTDTAGPGVSTPGMAQGSLSPGPSEVAPVGAVPTSDDVPHTQQMKKNAPVAVAVAETEAEAETGSPQSDFLAAAEAAAAAFFGRVAPKPALQPTPAPAVCPVAPRAPKVVAPTPRLHFSDFEPRQPARRGGVSASPSDITAFNMDRSDLLESILHNNATWWAENGNRPNITPQELYHDLIGEFQASFVAFLYGQVMDALTQWKTMLQLLCHCGNAMPHRPQLFSMFFDAVCPQLREISSDLLDMESGPTTHGLPAPTASSLEQSFRHAFQTLSDLEAKTKKASTPSPTTTTATTTTTTTATTTSKGSIDPLGPPAPRASAELRRLLRSGRQFRKLVATLFGKHFAEPSEEPEDEAPVIVFTEAIE